MKSIYRSITNDLESSSCQTLAMLVTIFSAGELEIDERYISVFSDNAMTRIDSLQTTFTEVQLANDERRGSLSSDITIIQNMTPTVFLIVLLIHSGDPETEFSNEQFANGDRYNCVFSHDAMTRVNNTETVFVNEQLARMEMQENLFSNNSITQVNHAAHIIFGQLTRRQRNNIQLPRNSTIHVNNDDTFLTESQYERHNRYMTVFLDYSTAQRNNIQTVFTEEQLERHARSTAFNGTY